ncbi:NHLP leader peptide family natural product precursor [Paenibacillaceae bacterium]|nr:NHLP leader peptide family natural product precursor [Paenibacillaceae bacterium]
MSAEQILKTQIIQKAWEDAAFKTQLLADPKAAIKDAFNIDIPDYINLTVVEESVDHLYLVIPPNPAEVLDGNETVRGMW